jgi:WD40 repeat protein
VRTLDAPAAGLAGARISSNGEWLAARAGRELFVWNRSGTRPRTHDAGEYATVRAVLALSDDGDVVALAADKLVSTATHKLVEIDGYKNRLRAWCSDNSWIATANSDRGIRVHTAASLKIHRMFQLESTASTMRMHPELDLLLVGDESGRASVFDLRGRQEVRSAPVTDSPVTCLAARGTRIVAGFRSGRIAALDIAPGGISVRWCRPAHSDAVHSVDIAPDDSCIATTGADSTVRTWSRTGGRLAALRLPGRMLRSTWTDGRRRLLVSGYTGAYMLGHEVSETALRTGIEQLD